MRGSTKAWLIVATVLILVGGITFVCMMTILKWDFTKLSTGEYETTSHEISESIKNISIFSDTADITFLPSEGSKCTVVCYEQKKVYHSVSVKAGTLLIKETDTRKWYEYIGLNFGTPKITVYIPQCEYGDLEIKSSTGDTEIPSDFIFENIDISTSTGKTKCYSSVKNLLKIKSSTGSIKIENISAGSLDLSVSIGGINASQITCHGDITINSSTGKTKLTDIACVNLFSKGNTGDIILNKVIASGKFSININTGDVEFESCDAAEIYVKTSTGDVEGTFLTDKIFITETGIGDIEVPKSITGGRCEITTGTGDIELKIQN